MESERGGLAAELRQADRAAAAPWIEYPATPPWYPVATGLWAALFCLTTAIPDESPKRALALLALVLVELVFVAWYRRRRGTWPRGRAPKEISTVMKAFVLGALAVIGVVGLTLWLAAPWVAAIVAFVVVTTSVAWYERVYAAAAARARTRLK